MIQFEFTYLVTKYKVDIDDENINIKFGIINKALKKQNLKAIYIKSYDAYNELILRYDNSKGKIKNQKLLFSHGEAQAIALADYLVENTNCDDLRNLNPKEAMKKIKAADGNKVAFAIVLSLFIIIPTVISLPWLMHYFDKGNATVSINQLISNQDLETSNITINDGMLINGIWYQTTTTQKGSTTVTTKDYFPIVPLNWTENDTIKIIVKTGDLTQEQVDNLFSQESISGVLENKLWEGGLGSDEVKFFKKQYSNYKLNDDLLILNIEPKNYTINIIMYISIIVLLVALALYIKSKMK